MGQPGCDLRDNQPLQVIGRLRSKRTQPPLGCGRCPLPPPSLPAARTPSLPTTSPKVEAQAPRAGRGCSGMTWCSTGCSFGSFESSPCAGIPHELLCANSGKEPCTCRGHGWGRTRWGHEADARSDAARVHLRLRVPSGQSSCADGEQVSLKPAVLAAGPPVAPAGGAPMDGCASLPFVFRKVTLTEVNCTRLSFCRSKQLNMDNL